MTGESPAVHPTFDLIPVSRNQASLPRIRLQHPSIKVGKEFRFTVDQESIQEREEERDKGTSSRHMSPCTKYFSPLCNNIAALYSG